MALLEKKLEIKTSTLPGAGKGLFTTTAIPKGTRIVEYKGKVTTWAKADHEDGDNAYIFFLNNRHVIDAAKRPSALARYANDARGLGRVRGISNNAEYHGDGKKVYITATKNIAAGAEILVQYGKDYWDVIKKNMKGKEKL